MNKLKPKVYIERHTLEIAELEARIRELEDDLKLNASMLAKQCDLAREAEARVKELEDAIRDHRDRDDRYIDGDRELYAVLEEKP